MDMFHPEIQEVQHKTKVNKSIKKRLTYDQVMLLERSFTTNKKLEPEKKQQLASQLGVPPRQIAIWYQNKRARWRTQSLEVDYSTIQVKLENALVENRRLEKEVILLKEELRKTHGKLYALNNYHGEEGALLTTLPSLPPPPPLPNPMQYNCINGSCNSSCDEGSSSLNEDTNCHEILQLQVDELYACLIGENGSSNLGYVQDCNFELV